MAEPTSTVHAPTDRHDGGDPGGAPERDRNLVLLTGKLSGEPERRQLPSGDEVVALRVVVRRDGGGRDTVPVQVGPGPAPGGRAAPGQVGRRELRAAESLPPGTRVEVIGTIRRRWWATPAGRRSRIEVVAATLRPS